MTITRAKQKEIIIDAIQKYKALDEQWRRLRALMCPDIDSPLGRAIWMASDNMLTNAALVAGDVSETLHWFVLENDCGRKRLKHSLPNSKRMIVVKDVATLLRVMGF